MADSEAVRMMPRQVVVGKRCLVYCGDERCDCDAGPLGRGLDTLLWPLVGRDAFDAMSGADFAWGLTVRVIARSRGERDRSYSFDWDPVNRAGSGFSPPLYAIRVRRRWNEMSDVPVDGTVVRLALTWPERPGELVRTEICFRGDGMREPAEWIEVETRQPIDLEPCGWEYV